MDPNKHPCDIGEGELDHDWKFHSDSQGDGWMTESYYWWECESCGEIDNDRDPPSYEDDL